MKRILLLVMILALLLPSLALAATTIDATANRGITPPKGLPNHPEISGQSMTTGLPVQTAYTPILVNIDNVAGAWPQWGIAQADIIYEMPIHGLTLTRLMALFAYSWPEAVGPVRSARVMHAEMREEWDAAWAYAGVQTKEGTDVYSTLRKLGARDKDVKLLFDASSSNLPSVFGYTKEYKSPHNHTVNLANVADLVKTYQFPQRAFLFTDELPTAGDAASRISLVFNNDPASYTNSEFVYDAASNLYTRYRNNKPYEDKQQPGQALTFSNFIIQWTELKFNGAPNAPMLKEVGEGNADIFMGGRHIAGYWVRESMTSRTVFYDENGQEIQLQRGKTFINIASHRATTVTYE